MADTETKELKVTTIKDLEEYKKGTIVELPAFSDDQPFCVRLKRPSLMSMAQNGEIPNELLGTANQLFEKGAASFDSDDPEMMIKFNSILDIFCEACLVEPTYEDIKNSGMELTDQQKLAIFGFSQTGVNLLKSFRK